MEGGYITYRARVRGSQTSAGYRAVRTEFPDAASLGFRAVEHCRGPGLRKRWPVHKSSEGRLRVARRARDARRDRSPAPNAAGTRGASARGAPRPDGASAPRPVAITPEEASCSSRLNASLLLRVLAFCARGSWIAPSVSNTGVVRATIRTANPRTASPRTIYWSSLPWISSTN
jgi:hypothetical protein